MQREILLLEEMVTSIEQIIAITARVDEADLSVNRTQRDALLWNFMVLGESSAQLSEEFKVDHSSVPWAQPARLRNRIVHGYWSIDLSILLAVASDDLPNFLSSIREILHDLDPS